ncbi:MAG: non-ribosomal peptide synthetase, partial [Myxococcaceae bacterium]
STEALRSFLSSRLPDYMLPAAFLHLAALPLTANAKLDRKALPAPDSRPALSQDFVAPRDDVESLLASLWASVLHLQRVGVHDNFFALGGHSLLATQALSRIRSAFGIDLPLRDLFDSPTVATLSLRIHAALLAISGPIAAPLLPVPRTGRLPLSFAQQRLFFLDQLEPLNPAYNIPAAVRLEGRLDVEVLERSLDELIRRHESLRTTFHSEQEEVSQRIAPPGGFTLPVEDLRSLPDSEREELAARKSDAEARRPFDLQRGPLLRATLLRTTETSHVLHLTMHHIVSDGWSVGLLIRELSALYTAFAKGLPSPLPALPIQYADFAAWQRQALRGETLEAQLSWWRQELEGVPQSLSLPTDFPRPSVQSFRGSSLRVHVPRALAEAVEALSLREGVTPFMTLLASFQLLLHRYCAQDDFCVGAPIAGRGRSSLEGLIGFFVNTLVHRARFSGNPSFLSHLARVKHSALGAFAHQDVPFEKLVEALQPERDLGRTPLFQVMFTLQPDALPQLALPGLRVHPLELHSATSKFDLGLSLTRTPDGFVGAFEFSTD